MTPAQALDMYRRQMSKHGEDVIVRRRTGGTITAEVNTRARVVGYEPREIVGAVIAGDRKVIALVDSLSSLLPVSTLDKIVVRGRECAIKAVDDNTRRVAGTLIALELQVAG
jgi:hypothetical protein